MSTFLITKFKSRTSSVEYRMSPTNNALFINIANDADRKQIMDFICSGTYQIKEIRRISDNVEFSIGDKIIFPGYTNGQYIGSITIENGGILLKYNGNTVKLENATKYTTPVVTAAPIVAQPIPVTGNQASKDAFFVSIQNQIISSNPRALRLRGLLRNRKTETLNQFLTKFFIEWNNPAAEAQTVKDTIFVDDETTQTVIGKRRSIGDLFMICKYYFPNVTVKQVYQCLMNELPTSISEGFRSSYCSTINKYVWYYAPGVVNIEGSKEHVGEYSKTYTEIKQKLA